MTGDSQAAVQNVREAWDRNGMVGVRDTFGAMAPEDQVRLSTYLYNERAIELLVAAIPDEFVHDMRPTGLPGMELYHGPAGYRRFLQEWLDAFPDSSLELESTQVAGHHVLAVVRQEMRGAGSGVPVTFQYAALIGFRDRRAIESEFHTDLPSVRARFSALAAAGRR